MWGTKLSISVAGLFLVLCACFAWQYYQSDRYASGSFVDSVMRFAEESGSLVPDGIAGAKCIKTERYRIVYAGYFVCSLPSDLDCRDRKIYLGFWGLRYRFSPDSLERQLKMKCGNAFPDPASAPPEVYEIVKLNESIFPRWLYDSGPQYKIRSIAQQFEGSITIDDDTLDSDITKYTIFEGLALGNGSDVGMNSIDGMNFYYSPSLVSGVLNVAVVGEKFDAAGAVVIRIDNLSYVFFLVVQRRNCYGSSSKVIIEIESDNPELLRMYLEIMHSAIVQLNVASCDVGLEKN